jgi:hypothetical protein
MTLAKEVTCVSILADLGRGPHLHLLLPSLHSPPQLPRGFRLSITHPCKHPRRPRVMSAAQVLASNGAFLTHALSPPKLAINGRSANGTSDRLQIINDEKQFTYVSVRVMQ